MGAEKWVDRLRTAVSSHCEGEVLSVAVFQPYGREGARALTGLLPISGAFRHVEVSGAASFKDPILIALTPDRFYVFEARPAGVGYRVERTAAVWNRPEVVLSISEGRLVYAFSFDVGPGGERHEVEALKKPLLGYRGVARHFIDAVREPRSDRHPLSDLTPID